MIRFNISSSQRLFLFVLLTLLCWIIASFVSYLIANGGITPARINLMMVSQDILVFIVPVLVTAIIITRTPADFLQVNKGLDWFAALLVVLILVVSAPVMNYVIQWNASIQLPESMAGLETWMREAEDSAAKSINMLLSGGSVMALIVGLITMCLLAGFSEELFFRGGLMRLLVTSGVRVHIAVWATAILFSAFHLQFLGFVPRMLLGALFGYSVVWSGSLWLGVLAHCINNLFAVVSLWSKQRGVETVNWDTVGAGSGTTDCLMVIVSAVLTVFLILALYRRCKMLNKSNK